MAVGVIERSASVWRVCVFLSIVGIIFFFLGFSIPHLIHGDFSDENSTFCGEIRAGLWEYCTRTCSTIDWQCGDWENEEDFLTICRVLQICAGSFAVLGFFLALISRLSLKKSYFMLLAAILNLLAASVGGSGIGIFLDKEREALDDEYGGMEHNSSNTHWAGGIGIAAVVIFFINTASCLVDWRYNIRLAVYREI